MKKAFTVEFIQEKDFGLLSFGGRISLETARDVLEKALEAIKDKSRSIRLDLSEVTFIDSHGLALLVELKARTRSLGLGFELGECSQCCQDMLKIVDLEKFLLPLPPAHAKEGFLAQVGSATLDLFDDIKNIVAYIGECSIMFLEAAMAPQKIRWRSAFCNLEQTGLDALPIMCMVQFLIGVILSVLGKTVLGRYGATAFIPDLVGIAMIQELGPIVTAVVLAGRSGAAYAAEIGTMKVSEEIDALKSLGFDPNHFLVLPKIIAAAIATPCLLIIGNLVAFIGSVLMCNLTTDITLPAYVNELYKAVNIDMLVEGITKAFVFAILIAGISCMRGMQVRGGAESVGRCTTAAVVSGIFITVLMDALFTILFHPPL